MPIVAEDNMVQEFKRRAHHYLSDLPKDGDNLEWLALMQHHGAATRLLDWTRSPYVAAFFAAEKATPLRSFAIWAINYRVVNTTVLEMMGLESSKWDPDQHSDVNFDAISSFPQPEGLYVAMAVAPFRMNQLSRAAEKYTSGAE